MNKDQLKGAAKELAGRLQLRLGRLTGNRRQQAEGIARQVEGKLRKKAGDMREAIKHAGK